MVPVFWPGPNTNTINTSTYNQVRQQADRDNDGVATKQELTDLRNMWARMRRPYTEGFAQQQTALNNMISKFSLFANKSNSRPYDTGVWYPNGRPNGINSYGISEVAKLDGVWDSISAQDLAQRIYPTPTPTPVPTPTPFPGTLGTLPTERYIDVHRSADTNNDQKVSKQELQSHLDSLNRLSQVADFTVEGYQTHQENIQMTQAMLKNFSHFANNRGMSPDAPRTLEFRIGEDDHIRENEIRAIAAWQGDPANMSPNEVNNRRIGPIPPVPPAPTPVPAPPPPAPTPNPPPPISNDIYQQLINLLIQVIQSMMNQFQTRWAR